jgi:hypothetical protein
MKVFLLQNLGIDKNYFFYGPDDLTDEGWQQLCDQWLTESVWDELETCRKNDTCVVWTNVIERLSKILTELGFTAFQPATVTYENQSMNRGTKYEIGMSGMAVVEYQRQFELKHYGWWC